MDSLVLSLHGLSRLFRRALGTGSQGLARGAGLAGFQDVGGVEAFVDPQGRAQQARRVAIIVGIALPVKWLMASSRKEAETSAGESPMEIVKRRYGAGETDKEESEEKREGLEGQGSRKADFGKSAFLQGGRDVMGKANSCGLAQQRIHKVPVDQVLNESAQIIGSPVLIIKVIGVLPHIDC